mmetsp:Transcript_8950/g.13011  ORF Transcript_8950/g.13011 Transcript_8950/m.13011 type:complete len:378 (-) Transcript_8950:527-1660(-)
MKCLSACNDVVNNIPQGVKFSPDGLCLLTALSNELRLYNCNSLDASALTCHGGDIVRSFDWYPHMDSNKPETCCFLGTSRSQPVHLYDAYTGHIRATYCPINLERDEPESPMAVKFSLDGLNLVCGGFPKDRYLSVFDINRPGKNSMVWRLGKTRRSSDGQKGLVSSISYTQFSPHVLAVGTYTPGSIYLYDIRASSAVATFSHLNAMALVGHGKNFKLQSGEGEEDDNFLSKAKTKWFKRRVQNGVTQLEFCNNDFTLVSASRNSDAIVSWDIRRMTCGDQIPMGPSKGYSANLDSNQRIGFHIDNEDLYIGGRDKIVSVYNITSGNLQRTISMSDVVNDVSVHASTGLLAVSLGERSFDEDEGIMSRGGIELWKI